MSTARWSLTCAVIAAYGVAAWSDDEPAVMLFGLFPVTWIALEMVWKFSTKLPCASRNPGSASPLGRSEREPDRDAPRAEGLAEPLPAPRELRAAEPAGAVVGEALMFVKHLRNSQ